MEKGIGKKVAGLRAKLTKSAVDKIAPPSTGKIIVWDVDQAGFGVVVTAQGVKSWIINYRMHPSMGQNLGRHTQIIGDFLGGIEPAHQRGGAGRGGVLAASYMPSGMPLCFEAPDRVLQCSVRLPIMGMVAVWSAKRAGEQRVGGLLSRNNVNVGSG